MDKSLEATNRWCSISNAIIEKYKPMSDPVSGDVDRAVEELAAIERLLVNNGYFSREDFKW